WSSDVCSSDLFFVNPSESKLGQGEGSSSQASSGGTGGSGRKSYNTSQKIGLLLGPILFFIVLFFVRPEDLSSEGIAILASTVWIATWWITEAIPIPVTSLLPLVLFPITKGLDVKVTASSYGDETIFLFMGGFMIALAMEKWNLHRRIALTIISVIGTNI